MTISFPGALSSRDCVVQWYRLSVHVHRDPGRCGWEYSSEPWWNAYWMLFLLLTVVSSCCWWGWGCFVVAAAVVVVPVMGWLWWVFSFPPVHRRFLWSFPLCFVSASSAARWVGRCGPKTRVHWDNPNAVSVWDLDIEDKIPSRSNELPLYVTKTCSTGALSPRDGGGMGEDGISVSIHIGIATAAGVRDGTIDTPCTRECIHHAVSHARQHPCNNISPLLRDIFGHNNATG